METNKLMLELKNKLNEWQKDKDIIKMIGLSEAHPNETAARKLATQEAVY